MDLYVPSFTDFYVTADSNDWGFSNSDIGSQSKSSSSSSTNSGGGDVKEEEKPAEVQKLTACEEAMRTEIEIEHLLRKDPRFLALKGMTHDDLENLRYEIKKDHPELAKVAFNNKIVLEYIWPYLLAGGIDGVPRKDSEVGTDDRRLDDDFSLSINTVANKGPNIGKHRKKHLKVSEEKKSHRHKREDILNEEQKKEEIFQQQENSVGGAGKFYLKNHGGIRFEKFGDEIKQTINEMEIRRLERTLWHTQIENAKPILALPSLIRKAHVVKREEMKKNLGPGTYEPNYYYEVQSMKQNLRNRGLMTIATKRFSSESEIKELKDAPQPEVRNPYTELKKAEDRYKHPSKKTLFEGARRCFRKIKYLGGPVGPGAYEVKSSIQEVLDKKVSKKGPYNVFSGPRDRIMFGYNKTRKINENLGPGSYFHYNKETPHYRFNTPHAKYKGKFPKLRPEDSEFQTGERNFVMAPLWPSARTGKLPGPGAYTIKDTIGSGVKNNKYPFNSTAPARIKSRWSDEQEVNPNRYRLLRSRKLLYNIKGNGMTSVFKNRAPARLLFENFAMATERLRGKDIRQEEIRRRWEQ